MRVLILLICVAIAGCAGKKPIPDPVAEIHTTSENITLEDVCFSLERHAIYVGLTKIKEPPGPYTAVSPALQGEVVSMVNTIYALPIKTPEDVDAVARLIYKNCILKHDR